MDRRQYYRILGLTEGATAAQIKQAYSRQMSRLKSPDYADDPEYAARKMDQVRHAYSVLTGSAAPVTKEQKEARFEKWKDAEDAGEDGIEGLKRAFQKHVRRCEGETELAAGLQGLKAKVTEVLEDSGISLGGSSTFGGEAFESRRENNRNRTRTKKTIYLPEEEVQWEKPQRNGTNPIKWIVISVVGLSIFSGAISACGSLVTNIAEEFSFQQATPEYAVEATAPAELSASMEEAGVQIEKIMKNNDRYDYYGNLDLSVQEDCAGEVDWDVMGESYGEIWGYMTDIAYYLGLYSNSDAIWYITGDENAYWENDDYTNAEILISIMNPPSFEDVAGGVNLHSSKIIINYAEYLEFIRDVAQFQTEELLG